MVGWHHRLDGSGFGWIPGLGDGQGGLACCSPWGRKESDITERLNDNDNFKIKVYTLFFRHNALACLIDYCSKGQKEFYTN